MKWVSKEAEKAIAAFKREFEQLECEYTEVCGARDHIEAEILAFVESLAESNPIWFKAKNTKNKSHEIQVYIRTKVCNIQELLEESDFVKTTQAKEHVFLHRISMRV